jgi:hypothetical protein
LGAGHGEGREAVEDLGEGLGGGGAGVEGERGSEFFVEIGGRAGEGEEGFEGLFEEVVRGGGGCEGGEHFLGGGVEGGGGGGGPGGEFGGGGGGVVVGEGDGGGLAEDGEDFRVKAFESGVEFAGGEAVLGAEGREFHEEGVGAEVGVAVETVGV